MLRVVGARCLLRVLLRLLVCGVGVVVSPRATRGASPHGGRPLSVVHEPRLGRAPGALCGGGMELRPLVGGLALVGARLKAIVGAAPVSVLDGALDAYAARHSARRRGCRALAPDPKPSLVFALSRCKCGLGASTEPKRAMASGGEWAPGVLRSVVRVERHRAVNPAARQREDASRSQENAAWSHIRRTRSERPEDGANSLPGSSEPSVTALPAKRSCTPGHMRGRPTARLGS
jgi:hypothetical protein